MSVIYTCSICHKRKVSGKAAEMEDDVCCMSCAEEHNQPGKFQQWSTTDSDFFQQHLAEPMGMALIFHEWAMFQGSADDEMHNDDWGSMWRFGKFLYSEDSQGFADYDEYDTVERAEKEFYSLYNDGWGASEWDYYISFDRGRWYAFDGDSGKEIKVWARNGHEYDDYNGIDRRRVLAAVSLHMRRTGYYPDVWEVNERGSITNVSKEVW